ncbi:PH domain-containing protein [Leucobacter sp. G161]|uniref:PH domain-containing protein n=1 Tax=Leucobacter sp. G161 TaxID=663704 RepID=UPI00073AECA1|nr:PH domain-containing protein [Leucobacter sp. G161]KUF07738.1 hypothetical protein AUL38_07855 [Leucobacter sp. G161]
MESEQSPRDTAIAISGERLPRRALTYANVQSVAACVVVGGAIALVGALVPVDWVAFVAFAILIPLILVMTAVDLGFLNRLQHRSYRYTVTAAAVETSRGVLLRARSTVSPIQILSIDTLQGPILRSCGLAVLVLQTVGGPVKLGPLLPEAAATVRNQVLAIAEETAA